MTDHSLDYTFEALDRAAFVRRGAWLVTDDPAIQEALRKANQDKEKKDEDKK